MNRKRLDFEAMRDSLIAVSGQLDAQKKVLEGKLATPDALAAAVRGRDVLHLAAHAITNSKQPERSALVLAPPDLLHAGFDPQQAETISALHTPNFM